jgi:hypothetical protein
MSRYTNLVQTYARLFYGPEPTSAQVQEIERLVTLNAELPKNIASMRGAINMMKTDQEIISELDNFQSAFYTAIDEEIEMGVSSVSRLRRLEYARSSPTMDLSLISRSAVRRELDDQFQSIARGSRSFSDIWITFHFSPLC